LLSSFPLFKGFSVNIPNANCVVSAKPGILINHLMQTGAVNNFMCAEPLLGDLGELDLIGIDWVVIGGESGRIARLTHHPL